MITQGKIILLILFSLFISNESIKAQEREKVEEYWETGRIKVEGNLVNNERHGIWREFHSSGQLKMVGEYKNGVNYGTWKYFCSHGVRLKEVFWENGLCKRIIFHFLDEDPYITIDFKKGISPIEYLQFHNNYELAKSTQLDLFTKTSEMDEKYFHYLSSGRLVSYFLTPYLYDDDGKMHYIPFELLHNLYKIDSLLMKNFKLITTNLSQETSIQFYYWNKELAQSLTVDSLGNVFNDSITYYEISPYGRFQEWRYVNNKLVEFVEYHPAVEWYQTCERYYNNGALESKGDYEKGLQTKIWNFYSIGGDLYKEVKYKKGQIVRTRNYGVSLKEINAY